MHDHLMELMGHMAWADAVALRTWAKGCDEADEELRRRWDHITTVQAAFLCVLTGAPLTWDPAAPVPSYDSLCAKARANHAGLRDHLLARTADGLADIVQMPWFDPPCRISVAQAFTQVAMHTQHHRGQVMTRMKEKGGAAKDVDFIVWLWKGKPEPRWQG